MSTESLQRKAYEAIQQFILSGRLAAGNVVSEASLSRELGIGRMPVREAIRQLQMEGVVEQIPRYGTVLRQPDHEEIIELYQLREALEPYAVALAVGRLSESDLAILQRLCAEIRRIGIELRKSGGKQLEDELLGRFLAADLGFHIVLARAAGNRRILKSIADSRVLTRIFSTQRLPHTLRIVASTYRSHRRMLAAIQRGDREAARRLTAKHIRASLRRTLKGMARFESPLGGRRPEAPLLPPDMLRQLQQMQTDLESGGLSAKK